MCACNPVITFVVPPHVFSVVVGVLPLISSIGRTGAVGNCGEWWKVETLSHFLWTALYSILVRILATENEKIE